MALIIDGYNLLHASGVIPSHGPGTLERARLALLQFLDDVLTEGERKQTTVVFDAGNAPPGLPHQLKFGGISVLFARHHQDADGLIEELLDESHAPRGVTVVSADHRLHRAARMRGASAIDSEVWWGEMRRRQQARRGPFAGPEKPQLPTDPLEVRMWLERLGFDPAADALGDGVNVESEHVWAQDAEFAPFSHRPPGAHSPEAESRPDLTDDAGRAVTPLSGTSPREAPRSTPRTRRGSDTGRRTSHRERGRGVSPNASNKRAKSPPKRPRKNAGPVPETPPGASPFPPDFGEGIFDEP